MDRRYSLTLPPKLDEELDRISGELQVSKSEVMRRALTLFKHAVDADTVKVTKGGLEREVLIK
jgi:hypothetical protein